MSAEEVTHAVVRLSNSQVALLASALNPHEAKYATPVTQPQMTADDAVLHRAKRYEAWLRQRQTEPAPPDAS